MLHFRMKYWSCCQKKTSDFSNFLAQEGCEKGKHLWVKEEVIIIIINSLSIASFINSAYLAFVTLKMLNVNSEFFVLKFND